MAVLYVPSDISYLGLYDVDYKDNGLLFASVLRYILCVGFFYENKSSVYKCFVSESTHTRG